MKAREIRILCLLTIITLNSIIILSGCIENIEKGPQEKFLDDFEVHEWGVFYQKYDSNQMYLQNPSIKDPVFIRPPPVVYPMKPIIYFHYNENLSEVVVEVKIKDDLITIPNATIKDDWIQWNFSLKNNKVVLDNQSIYDYLFYEGRIDYNNPLTAFVYEDNKNITFYLKNNADFPLTHVIYCYCIPKYNNFYDPGPILSPYNSNITEIIEDNAVNLNPTVEVSRSFVYFEEIKPGEEIIIEKNKDMETGDFNYSELIDVLEQKGLTKNETDDLVDYWDNIWFKPQIKFNNQTMEWEGDSDFKASSQILYFIPEQIYDEMLPIKIDPEPEIMKRIGMFFISDIPTWTPSNLFITKSAISIETDKNIYKQGDQIKITIRNGVDKKLYSIISDCEKNILSLFSSDDIKFNFHLLKLNSTFSYIKWDDFSLIQGNTESLIEECINETYYCSTIENLSYVTFNLSLDYIILNNSIPIRKSLPNGIYRYYLEIASDCDEYMNLKNNFKHWGEPFFIIE